MTATTSPAPTPRASMAQASLSMRAIASLTRRRPDAVALGAQEVTPRVGGDTPAQQARQRFAARLAQVVAVAAAELGHSCPR